MYRVETTFINSMRKSDIIPSHGTRHFIFHDDGGGGGGGGAEKERATERERQRQTDTETDRQSDRQMKTEID